MLPSVFAVIYKSSFLCFEWVFYVSVNLVAVPSVWIRDTVPWRVLRCLAPRPHHTYPFVFENGGFFPSGLAYRPPVSGENGHWKRIFYNIRYVIIPHTWRSYPFQIALQSRNFRKRRLLDSCGWRKKRIRHGVGSSRPRARDETKCACSNQRRYRFQSLLHFRLDGEKTIQKRNVRRKAEKKISTFKQKRIRVNRD